MLRMGSRTLKKEQVNGNTVKLVKDGDQYRVEEQHLPPLMDAVFHRKDRAETEFKRRLDKYY